jgi:anti-anti-sigma regulatory factor
MAKAKKNIKPAKKPASKVVKKTVQAKKSSAGAQSAKVLKNIKTNADSAVKSANAANFVYPLNEVMDISYASNFHGDMTKIFSKKFSAFVFDASKIQRLTTPCIQIIISVAKTCVDKNIEFSINNPSDLTQKVFNDLGLTSQLLNNKFY